MGLFEFLESSFLSSLYILDISPLSDLGLVKILSQSVGGLFVLLTVSFALQKLCNFMRSHLSILDVQHKSLLFCSIASVLCLTEALQFYEVPFVNSCCSGNFPLCPCAQDSSPLTFLLVSMYLVLWGGPWSIWNWALYKEARMVQFALFYKLTSTWNSTICWKCWLFYTGLLLAPLSKIKWP